MLTVMTVNVSRHDGGIGSLDISEKFERKTRGIFPRVSSGRRNCISV
jgi:hypothetical protein